MLEALARYIWSGGENWQSTASLNFVAFSTFVLYLTYNVARGCLLWKTKKLETQQLVSGLPVSFSLDKHWWWKTLFRITRWGFWIAIALATYHLLHFLTMEVPIKADVS